MAKYVIRSGTGPNGGPTKRHTEQCERLRRQLDRENALRVSSTATDAQRHAAGVRALGLQRQLMAEGCNDNKFGPAGGDGVEMIPMDY